MGREEHEWSFLYACRSYYSYINKLAVEYNYIVGRRIEIFLRLKADGKIVVFVTSVASFAKVLYVNKS